MTLGTRRRDHDETSLIIVFSSDRQDHVCRLVIQKMDQYAEMELIKTRQIQLQVGNERSVAFSEESRNAKSIDFIKTL